MYLEGTHVKPKTNKDAKTLIGKRVSYLRRCDIETSRGMAFPRSGMIDDVLGKNLLIDGDYLYFNDIVEMVIME